MISRPRRLLLVLFSALVLTVAGCGGGDDDDGGDSNEGASAETASTPSTPTGARSKGKVVAALELEAKGNGYVFPSGCAVREVGWDAKSVKALEREGGAAATIGNDAGTVAVLLTKNTGNCAIEAKLRVQSVP